MTLANAAQFDRLQLTSSFWTTHSDITLLASANDYALPDGYLFRIDPSGGPWSITGMGNGYTGRQIVFVNVGVVNLVLTNQDVASVAANRVITGTGANVTVVPDGSIRLFYDGTTARWRVI